MFMYLAGWTVAQFRGEVRDQLSLNRKAFEYIVHT